MNYFVNVIQPQIQKIGRLTILKWISYALEIIFASKVFGEIYDNIRLRTNRHTYCIPYGSGSRCSFGAQMTFLGLLVSMYALNSSVFTQYRSLPLIMQVDELELATFRLGIWLITGYFLDSWFKIKYNEKYKTGRGHPKDKLDKIKRLDKMIGPQVRKVYKYTRYVNFLIIISIIILCFEKWEMNKEKKKSPEFN